MVPLVALGGGRVEISCYFFMKIFLLLFFFPFFFPRFCEASNGWLIFFWFEVPLGLELICRRVTSFRWELNVKWIGQHWCLGAR